MILSIPVSAQVPNVNGAPSGMVQCHKNGVWVTVPAAECPSGTGSGIPGVPAPRGAVNGNPNADAESEAAANAASASAQQKAAADQAAADAAAAAASTQNQIDAQKDMAAWKQRQQDIINRMKGMADQLTSPKPIENPVPSVQPYANLNSTPGACNWGNLDSSVVDLRCLGLDPDKPIVIDPAVVKGRDRVSPAQYDPATFQNQNFVAGCLVLLEGTPEAAQESIMYLKKAQAERPNDPLVRNALGLSEAALKNFQRDQQEKQVQAVNNMYQSMAAAMSGDTDSALNIAIHATKLDPKNEDAMKWSLTMAAMKHSYKDVTTPNQKAAEKLVGDALLSESFGRYKDEVRALEAAKRLYPDDKFASVVLDHAHRLVSTEKPAAR
jgi:hypothetical protein